MKKLLSSSFPYKIWWPALEIYFDTDINHLLADTDPFHRQTSTFASIPTSSCAFRHSSGTWSHDTLRISTRSGHVMLVTAPTVSLGHAAPSLNQLRQRYDREFGVLWYMAISGDYLPYSSSIKLWCILPNLAVMTGVEQPVAVSWTSRLMTRKINMYNVTLFCTHKGEFPLEFRNT